MTRCAAHPQKPSAALEPVPSPNQGIRPTDSREIPRFRVGQRRVAAAVAMSEARTRPLWSSRFVGIGSVPEYPK